MVKVFRPAPMAIILLVLAIEAGAAGLSVEIETPRQEGEVGVEAVIKGKVSDPGARIYVLVRPLKTRYWWIQRLPSPPSRDGKWQSLCVFGTPTEGRGEPYEIVAIAAKRSLALREGQTLEEIPKQGVTSDVVTVRRSP